MPQITNIIETFNKKVKAAVKKRMIILLRINSVLFIGTGVFGYLTTTNDTNLFVVLFFASGFLLLIGGILQLIFYLVKPEKPTFNYLYEKMINDINEDTSNDYTITYEAYVKDKEVIRRAGVFSRFVSKHFRFKLKFYNDNNKQITVYNSYLYSQTNNARVTYLDGYYIVIPSENNLKFQLRKKSKPRLKGTKFKRVKKDSDIRVYKEEDAKPVIKKDYVDLYYMKMHNPDVKKIIVAGIEDEIHVALEEENIPKKVTKLDIKEYTYLKETLLKQLRDINQFSKNL
ncbi:MAG: hypothetical protein K9L74_02155 [Candidatus Izimaplasma sp.]|nr:hypothetical protein [Candidatus Izimaplasma bacterium]